MSLPLTLVSLPLLILILLHATSVRAEEAVPAGRAASTSECAREIAERVQRQYDSVRDFSARFSQTTRSALFGGAGDAAPVRGSVVLAKPGKMRWTYETPEPSLLVSDGKIMWLYSPGLKEAQRLPVTEGYLTGAALQFLLGDGKLLEAFDVSALVCDSEANASTVELTLTPREPATYERLGLRVAAKSGEVLGTSLVDLFGNETVIEFESVERNQQPDDARFHFVPPEGVEVIDLGTSP